MKTRPAKPPGGHALRALFTSVLFGGMLVLPSALLHGQPTPTGEDPDADEDEAIVLSPFVVDSTLDRGYQATNTLAGTRIRTDLADVGSAISVITSEMLDDLGAKNNETVLAYAVNTEVGGPRGNFSGGIQSGTYREDSLFANPNGNTRVRGLTSADNTRNYFLSDVPWDGYTVNRVDLQRGPNAILFGLGSPAGVVNATTNVAMLHQSFGSAEVAFDKHSSQRYVLDYNRVLLDKQLALRVALLRDDQKFQQEPAFSLDERAYAAVKYAPSILNRAGHHFQISGNFEKGSIESNRPRIMTPQDLITGFWDPASAGGVDRETFNYLTDDTGDTASPDYRPAVGGDGLGEVVNLINSNRTIRWEKPGVDAFRALRPDGSVIDTMNADEDGPWPRANAFGMKGIRPYNEWASVAGLPFGNFGAYSAKTITDPSVFDFYHKLIDGDNKREYTDWEVLDLNLSHTFLEDTLGYDIAYFYQHLKREQWSALGWNNALRMDINEVTADGSPNPDLGRAYVQVEHRNGGNGTQVSNRDALRGQLFGEYDFSKKHDGWWARLLGLHRLTGVVSQENQQQDIRSNVYMHLDPESMFRFTPEGKLAGTAETFHPGFRFYLSDDLRGASGPAGLNVGNLSTQFLPDAGGQIDIRRFDNTWTAGANVDPGALWSNPLDPEGEYTQSNNPANYRGWTNTNVRMVTVHSPGQVIGISPRDYLTEEGEISTFKVDSKVFVWQAHLWDKALIGTYGYREDKARSYIYATSDRMHNSRPDTGGANLSPLTYHDHNPDGTIENLETTTRNWSVVAHLNRLLSKRDFLPLNVSLYYNEGENFQPLAGRIDAYARPLIAPSGTTKEYSILLATKDGKYSLRTTKYETDVLNGNSTGGIGAMWALEQSFEFTGNLARDFRSGRSGTGNYADAGGDVARLQNQILPAWFAFEREIVTRFPEFVRAWMGPSTPFGTDNNGSITARSPSGFSFTEDSHSEGYEFEFTANPTANWRIALNASKTEASRTNVPGLAFKEVADYLDNAMQTTDVGLAPVWWDGNVFGGRNVGPYTIFRPDWLQINALNGQSAAEVRRWRFNALTNYTFTEGALKGFGLGGGYRWEDRAVIDYAPMLTAAGDNAVNLNAPFYAPTESTIDLWLSYERKLTEKIKWKIQLNVYNVFGENELIPFAASVDYAALGSGAITPTTVVPMRGSAFHIREGRSWTITNTFSF